MDELQSVARALVCACAARKRALCDPSQLCIAPFAAAASPATAHAQLLRCVPKIRWNVSETYTRMPARFFAHIHRDACSVSRVSDGAKEWSTWITTRRRTTRSSKRRRTPSSLPRTRPSTTSTCAEDSRTRAA
eukprot:3241275-Pleurochrysis_carterae.AAC.4